MSEPGPSLRLTPQASFRVLDGAQVEVVVRDRRLTITVDEQRALLGFGEARPAREAAALLGEDGVARFRALGLLVTDEAPDEDLRSLLRVDLFAPPLRDALSAELRAGRVCIIRDAFRPELADRIHRLLDENEDWEPYERARQPYTTVASHGILDRRRYPEELLAFEQVLGSPRSKALVSSLTGEDCEGDLMLDATLYLPGDHLAPHSDVGGDRAVSFVWQLARDWQPRWGGHFFWCMPPANVSPTFNTLLLYRVTTDGYHAVTTVSPWARGRRLSVSGWWTARNGTSATRSPAGAWYRGAVRPLGDGEGDVLVIG